MQVTLLFGTFPRYGLPDELWHTTPHTGLIVMQVTLLFGTSPRYGLPDELWYTTPFRFQKYETLTTSFTDRTYLTSCPFRFHQQIALCHIIGPYQISQIMTLTSFHFPPPASQILSTGWTVPVDSQICMIEIQHPLPISVSNHTNFLCGFTCLVGTYFSPSSLFSSTFEIGDCFSSFPI